MDEMEISIEIKPKKKKLRCQLVTFVIHSPKKKSFGRLGGSSETAGERVQLLAGAGCPH